MTDKAGNFKSRRFELRSVGVWSSIKICFFLNLIIGFGAGFAYALVFYLFVAVQPTLGLFDGGMDLPEESIGSLLIVLPFFFACGNALFGTIIVALLASFYNLAARLVGGLDLELQVNDFESVRQEPGPETANSMPQTIPVQAARPVPTARRNSTIQPLPPPPPPTSKESDPELPIKPQPTSLEPDKRSEDDPQ
ncbi:MAG: DUF3566 domain-containing protein [candidate division Zixibacteria bacterium]